MVKLRMGRQTLMWLVHLRFPIRNTVSCSHCCMFLSFLDNGPGVRTLCLRLNDQERKMTFCGHRESWLV